MEGAMVSSLGNYTYLPSGSTVHGHSFTTLVQQCPKDFLILSYPSSTSIGGAGDFEDLGGPSPDLGGGGSPAVGFGLDA